MKISAMALALVFMLCGCAQICEFGKAGDSSGLKCYGFFSQSKVGQTQKEVKERIGSPQRKNMDVEYRGKKYDEVWIYDTAPPTILYFKNGILEHKEYQQ